MKVVLLPLQAALLSTASFIPLSSAFAATNMVSQENEIEEVIVTANRREQPISEIGSSVSIITDIDIIQGQYNFVLDALADVSGVSISQNGSFGGTASVSIRGAGGDNTVILIDGVQMNDPSSPGNGYNFAGLDPHYIERIEVLKGPQSVLYGSDAMGGVINVITKSGQQGFGGNIFGEYGSFETFRGGVNLYGGSKKIGYNFSASGTQTDGISAADENEGNTEKDGYKAFSLNGKITLQASEILKSEIITRYSDNRGEFDNFGPIDGDQVAYFDEFLIAGRTKLDLLDGRFKNTVSVEYSSIDRISKANGVESFTAKGKRFNIDYLGVYSPTDDWAITVGAQHEETKAESIDSNNFSINSLLGEVAFTGVKNLVLTGGVRLDDHETFGSEITSRITGSYIIEETGTRIIANWAEGFKAPTIFQLTYICGFCGLTAPSSNLNPEKSNAYEFGFDQSLWDEKITFGATFFHQNLNNAIIFTFTEGYQNRGRSKSSGFEVSMEAELSSQLQIDANYTLTNAKDRETDERLLRQPKHELFGAITWTPNDKFLAHFSATYNAKEFDFGNVEIAGWTRFDFRASYNVTDTVEVYGRIDNIFNKEYQHSAGFGTADRSVYVGMRSSF